jgi:hypothetical protein
MRPAAVLAGLSNLLRVAAHSSYQQRIPNGNANGQATDHFGEDRAFRWDFRAAGYVWTTALCQADNDDDGQSNGLELGDPCCVWCIGADESSLIGFSNTDITLPGDSTKNTSRSMPSCVPEASASKAWMQLGSDIDGEAIGDESGTALAMSADGLVVAIGAPRNDGSFRDAGHVRVYAYTGSSWVKRGADIDGEAELDQSGLSVSLSDDGLVLAIGAWQNDGAATNAGHVRVS